MANDRRPMVDVGSLMPSKLDIENEPDVAGDRPAHGGFARGGSREDYERWLLERIAVLTHPYPPRILERKDGSFELQRKMSARWVRERLKEEGIELPLKRVLAYQDKIHELGIVRTIINLSSEECEVHRLENKLKRRFTLRGRVLLVSGFPEMLDEELTSARRRYLHEQVMQKMVTLLAAYLDELLVRAAAVPRPDGAEYTVTIGGGRTMRLLSDELVRTPRPGPWPSPLRFQAAVGPTGAHQGTPEEANAIVRRIAAVFGAVPGEMLNEALVTRQVWDLVKTRPAVANALRWIYEGDLFLTTVGAGDGRIANDDKMHTEVLAAVRALKVVANICTVMLNEDGREVRTRHVGVGPTYEGLRKMARDPNRRVVVATGGDARYMLPVLAALRSGLVSDLITDTVTAAWLAREIIYTAA